MHLRRQIIEIISRYKKSILLLGPRQTGKSTLIGQLKPDLVINLADEETYLSFLRDPGLLRRRITDQKTIFIDEIQKIPSLLNTVQALIDGDQSLRFYLTGSSARKLRRGHANLLPGRVLMFHLGPLCATELGGHFDIDRLLKLGALPGIYTEDNADLAQKVLRTYAQTYIKEEIQAEALTRNLEGFSRFFDVVAARSGDSMDFTKFSSQASIERTTARRYFDILVDTLVVESVGPFSKSGKKRLIQHPKFYFFDVGVLNGALSNFEVSSDRKGRLFEHLCLQMILSEAKSRDEDIRVSVYRTEAGAEVDFIVERNREVFAIEAKASKGIGSHDLRGLKSFAQYHRPAKSMIFYLGEHPQLHDGIEILPFQQGLNSLFA